LLNHRPTKEFCRFSDFLRDGADGAQAEHIAPSSWTSHPANHVALPVDCGGGIRSACWPLFLADINATDRSLHPKLPREIARAALFEGEWARGRRSSLALPTSYAPLPSD
jgi:hypothetical protein